MNTYYFPIQSTSLAHYLGGACIKAAKYFNNKPQDIQDKYNDFLLLTSKKGTTETDCCLELVLTDDEIKDLIDVKENWYLFDTKPLPITRIKKIYFSNKEQKDVTITNITMSTSYVPSNLVEICKFDNNSSDSIQIPKDCQGVDQTNKINQYDRFLGALALMRIAHEPSMNYSQNYIATLSFFNQEIEKQLKSNEKLSYDKKFPYRGIFSNNNGFKKILPYLEQLINEDSLNRIAQENNQVVKKDKITRIIDVESFDDTGTYTIAILNTYGVGDESRKKRVDGLIQSNFSTLKEGKQEGVALCYGYNRGYSAFTKNYGDVAFKYKLKSQLDYYTIESVYQYVFNGIVSSDLPYLDSWCPKLNPKPSKIEKKYLNYVILDEVIIGKKDSNDSSPKWWNVFSQKLEKIFGSKAKDILESIKPIIENDVYKCIKDEVQESFGKSNQQEVSLQNELNALKEKLSEAEKQNRMLQNELKSSTIHNYQRYQSGPVKNQGVVAESIPDYGTNSREEKLKDAIVKYQDCTLGGLKAKARKQKQKINDDIKLGDLLQNLTNNNDLFS